MTITRQDVEQVLEVLRDAFPAYVYRYDDDGNPTGLDPDVEQPTIYEPGHHAADWTIAWEGGPYDWALLFPHGGVDEEATELVRQAAREVGASNLNEIVIRVPDVGDRIPSHVFIEAVASWCIAICSAEQQA